MFLTECKGNYSKAHGIGSTATATDEVPDSHCRGNAVQHSTGTATPRRRKAKDYIQYRTGYTAVQLPCHQMTTGTAVQPAPCRRCRATARRNRLQCPHRARAHASMREMQHDHHDKCTTAFSALQDFACLLVSSIAVLIIPVISPPALSNPCTIIVVCRERKGRQMTRTGQRNQLLLHSRTGNIREKRQ